MCLGPCAPRDFGWYPSRAETHVPGATLHLATVYIIVHSRYVHPTGGPILCYFEKASTPEIVYVGVMTGPLAPPTPETLPRKYFGRVEALRISRGLRRPKFHNSTTPHFTPRNIKNGIVTLRGSGAQPRESESLSQHELHNFGYQLD